MSDDLPTTQANAQALAEQHAPVGGQTQELRFAMAITGGTSLAIWMGGVAREVNLLQRASNEREQLAPLPAIDPAKPDETVRAIYQRLLNLLDMTVEADILAGTSAGGINAALLGMARVNNLDLGALRQMWLDRGELEKLLRDPAHDAPPSLLLGDGELLTGLQKSLKDLWPSDDATTGELPPTRVHLTTTLLDGETGRFTDAYGTLVQDVDHLGMFTFDEQQLARPLPCREALATAARSTASFPFAFEPGFVAPDDTDGRPGMRDYSNITRAHWVSDGGLVMQRPIQPLVQEIFDRRAERHVRRVLLYVIPSPGDQPDPRSTPKTPSLTEPLSAAAALIGDVKAVMQQSIASDLRAVRDHNDRVDSLCDTRLRMAALGTRLERASTTGEPPSENAGGEPPSENAGSDPLPGMSLIDEPVLADYRTRQSLWFAQPVVAALMRDVTSRPQATLPKAWSDALAPGTAIEAECKAMAAEAIAGTWTTEPAKPGASWLDDLARFGLAPYDGAKAIAIKMVRGAFALAETPGQRDELGRTLDRVHKALRLVPENTDAAPPPFQRPRVGDVVRDGIESIFGEPARPSGEDDPYPGAPTLPALAVDLTCEYQDKLAAAAGDLQRAWSELADALSGAFGLFEQLAPNAAARPALQPADQIRRDRLSRERAARELRTYLDFLAPHPGGVAAALFDLHVATRSVLPVAVEVEQPVALVQLSADSRTLLSGLTTARQKLTGMQLHHFGAFYKASWRASDWTWGRVDGAGWLVHLLLDPRRIAAIAEAMGIVADSEHTRAEQFFDRLQSAIGAGSGQSYDNRDEVRAADVVKELGFLVDERPLPTSLPKTALWVAREIQRWIAAAELPVVAVQTRDPPSPHADTRQWADEVLAIAAEGETPGTGASVPRHVRMGEQLRSCPVAGETLAGELGQPLMTKTITKAAAVAAAMATEVPRQIAVLGPPLTALRTLTMAAYRVVTATGGAMKWLMTAGAVLLVVGTILALSSTSLFGVAGAGLATLGFYVIAIVTWGRTRKVLAGLLAGLVIGGLLALGAAREALFGNAERSADSCSPDDIGWFGCEALPWLASSSWHAVFAIVVCFGVAALVVFALTRRRPAER